MASTGSSKSPDDAFVHPGAVESDAQRERAEPEADDGASLVLSSSSSSSVSSASSHAPASLIPSAYNFKYVMDQLPAELKSPFDDVLLEASLNPKDQGFLLKLDLELEAFVMAGAPAAAAAAGTGAVVGTGAGAGAGAATPSPVRHEFPAMTSYHRLLLHRLAPHFRLDHVVDSGTKSRIILFRHEHSIVPPIRISRVVQGVQRIQAAFLQAEEEAAAASLGQQEHTSTAADLQGDTPAAPPSSSAPVALAGTVKIMRRQQAQAGMPTPSEHSSPAASAPPPPPSPPAPSPTPAAAADVPTPAPHVPSATQTLARLGDTGAVAASDSPPEAAVWKSLDGNTAAAAARRESKRGKTLEEREQEYERIKARIFQEQHGRGSDADASRATSASTLSAPVVNAADPQKSPSSSADPGVPAAQKPGEPQSSPNQKPASPQYHHPQVQQQHTLQSKPNWGFVQVPPQAQSGYYPQTTRFVSQPASPSNVYAYQQPRFPSPYSGNAVYPVATTPSNDLDALSRAFSAAKLSGSLRGSSPFATPSALPMDTDEVHYRRPAVAPRELYNPNNPKQKTKLPESQQQAFYQQHQHQHQLQHQHQHQHQQYFAPQNVYPASAHHLPAGPPAFQQPQHPPFGGAFQPSAKGLLGDAPAQLRPGAPR